jgi:hypothetical protein
MIKPIFDKSIVTQNYVDIKVPFEDILWISGSLGIFYCKYYEDYVEINFSIEDFGNYLLIKIYESTDYVKIMGLEDSKKYFQNIVVNNLENDFQVFQELLRKTKSFKDNSPVIDYEEVGNLGYLHLYGNGSYLKTGKSTLLVNFFPEININYRVWKTEMGWNNFHFEILDESDRDIREMKKHIVKKYYKNRYRYGRSSNK